MKHTIHFGILIAIFILSGCDLVDKVKDEYERIKHKYEEYIGEEDTRGEKPFTVVFQQDENAKTTIISSQCNHNQIPKYVYFSTPTNAHQNFFNATKNLYSFPLSGILKPYWDTRYTNPVSQYVYKNDGSHYPDYSQLTGLDARNGINNTIVGSGLSQVDHTGNVVQSECIENKLALGTTINLFDAPEQYLTYAGPQSTFSYQIHTNNHIAPWKTNGKGNLMIQASFDTPIYHNFDENIGGSISFNVFLYNPKINKHLNYVIGVYAIGEAWQKEKAGIRFDPTTNIIHVATVIKDDSWWSTKSPKSQSIQEVYNIPNKVTQDDGQWNDFYRINISYQNLLAVLNQLQTNPPQEVAGENFGTNPQEWEVILLAVQYELEEQGGKASLSGSFQGFEAYASEDPL